jgi:hypothetical protein
VDFPRFISNLIGTEGGKHARTDSPENGPSHLAHEFGFPFRVVCAFRGEIAWICFSLS